VNRYIRDLKLICIIIIYKRTDELLQNVQVDIYVSNYRTAGLGLVIQQRNKTAMTKYQRIDEQREIRRLRIHKNNMFEK